MNRVVVTGMAGLSPLGCGWEQTESALRQRKTGIQYIPDWERFPEMNTRLAAPVEGFSRPAHYDRKKVRSMGRVAMMATYVTELALESAGLLHASAIKDGSMGVSYGSSTGSTDAVADFGGMLVDGVSRSINANSYLKMMSHTAAVNIGIFFQLKGRVITTSSACTSGSQGIGYAYEAIKYGHQTMMAAGGGEELCPTEAAVFDTLFATSTMNDAPRTTPRPFDKDRDGLVIGEGACTLILEELEHAKARGAHIYAEIVGFGTNSDGSHVTQPNRETMHMAMKLALDESGLSPDAIGYVSAHGTATERGDIAESQATERLLGRVPISSLKSYTGHTLGACGALEAWASIEMMNRGWFHPTVNLEVVDPECADLDYITSDGRNIDCEYVMNNNFAFGGINTSLVFKRWN